MSKVSRAEYYEKAFEHLEKTGKHSWNWAAFFWGFSWMKYRKIYLFSVVFSIIYAIVFILSLIGIFWAVTKSNPLGELGITSFDVIKSMPVVWGGAIFWFLLSLGKRICLGRFGNALYYWTVKKRIGRGYHLLEKYRPTSIVAIVCPFFIWIADIVSHTMQLDKVLGDDVTVESIHAYLNPNKKNHWTVKTVNVLALIFLVFGIIWDIFSIIAHGVSKAASSLACQPLTNEINEFDR